MKPFSLFFPDLLPLVPGCPEPVAELALRRAAQRFCELTRAWRVEMDPVILVADIDVYDLELPSATELVRIEAAALNGQRLRVAPVDEAGGGRSQLRCLDGRQIVLEPAPAGPGSLVVTASVKPGDSALALEDFMVGQHRDLIARGAAARLKQQPGKTYSDPTMGLTMWSSFESDCASVRERVRRGFGRVPPRVRAHIF